MLICNLLDFSPDGAQVQNTPPAGSSCYFPCVLICANLFRIMRYNSEFQRYDTMYTPTPL